MIQLVFALLSNSVFAFTVVIDPGHGGVDVGASRGLFIESQIVFQIAEKIKHNLAEKSDIKIFISRPANGGKSLEDRVKFAHEKKADLFLSLHANSSTSTQVSGMEYYFSSKQPGHVLLRGQPITSSSRLVDTVRKDLVEFGKIKESLEFSKKVQSSASSFLEQTENENLNAKPFGNERKVKSKIRRAPFYVIENTEMPAVLVEVGFISNQREARKLVTPEYQAGLARALSDAIQNYQVERTSAQRKE